MLGVVVVLQVYQPPIGYGYKPSPFMEFRELPYFNVARRRS